MANVLAFFFLAVLVLASAVSSARLGHHPPGQGHHAAGHGRHHHHLLSIFVFGDEYADNGNLPRRDSSTALSRQWYFPYSGTGRFSNLFVMPDFVAKLVGHDQSPPPRALGGHHASRGTSGGLNFAVGGSGVFAVPQGARTLGKQVDGLDSLVQAGGVSTDNAVGLVAMSGHDYDRVTAHTAAFVDIALFVERVTAEIVATTARLQSIGIKRIIVSNLIPFGCAPTMTRPTNHTACDELANKAAALHNQRLADKLAAMKGVFLLDLSSAFNAVLKHHGDGGGEVAKNFIHKLKPCCESLTPGGFCGELDGDSGDELYKLCEDPQDYFFWDETSPTQAGWAAVMAQLESDIKEFLHME